MDELITVFAGKLGLEPSELIAYYIDRAYALSVRDAVAAAACFIGILIALRLWKNSRNWSSVSDRDFAQGFAMIGGIILAILGVVFLSSIPLKLMAPESWAIQVLLDEISDACYYLTP